MDQAQRDADQGDTLDRDLAPEEGRGGKIDVGLGGDGHRLAVLIQDAGAQNHQIDPVLLPVPLYCGFVILQGNAGQGALDCPRQGLLQGPQRHRTHQQPDACADDKKHNSGNDRADAERGMADVVGLNIIGKRQLQRT